MPSSNGDSDSSTHTARRSADNTTYATMDELTRRRLLSLGAATSLSSLVAGCGGQQDDSPEATTDVTVDTDTEPGGEPDTTEGPGTTEIVEEGKETTVRTVVNWSWPADETTMNYNAPSNFPGGYSSTFFFTPMTLYSKQDQRYYPVMLKELPSFDRCFQLHIFKEDFTFWDGFEHNAYDQVYGHQANAYACCGGPDEVSWNAQIYEEHEKPRFAYKENKGAAYAPDNAAGNAQKGVRWRRDIFKPIFERLQDATTDDEISKAVEDYRNIDLNVGDADQHNAGTSMWKPVEATADKITMEVYDDHPFADNTNLDRWEIQVAPKLQTELQIINNNGVDFGSTNFGDLQNPPEALNVQDEFIGDLGKGLAFNWRRKVPGDRAFRRAVAYLLPMERIAGAASQTGLSTAVVDQQTTSAPRDIVERGTDDGFLDNIIDYGVDTRPDKAAQVLRDAGYTKESGTWFDPDGDRIQLRLIAETLAVNSNIGAAISGTMNDFGLATNFSVLESGTYRQAQNPDAGNFDYDMHLLDMGVAQGLSDVVGESGNAASIDAGEGWFVGEIEECQSAAKNPKRPKPDVLEEQDDGSGFLTYEYGIPITEEGLFPPIPNEIGQEDLSGETYRPDLGPRSWWTSFRFDPDTIREWNTEHLWWANFYMPKIYFYTRRVPIWMDEENFELTADPAADTMGNSGKFWAEQEDKHPFVFAEANGR